MEDRERRIGWWVSGGAHTALLLWAILGVVFFKPQESTPVRSTQVATISGAEFEALAAASRGAGPVNPDATAVATMSEPSVEENAGSNPAAASAPEPESAAQELAQPNETDAGPDLSDFADEQPVEVATDLPNTADNQTESRDVAPESPAQTQAPTAERQPTQPQAPQTDQAAQPVAPRSELALEQSSVPQQRPDGLVENYRARIAAQEAARQAAAEAARAQREAAAEAAEQQRLAAEREAAEEARQQAAEQEEARRQAEAEAEAAAEDERQAEEARAAERREAAERRAAAEREAAAEAEREQAATERAEREAAERREAEAQERRAEEERRETARREAEQEQQRREAEARDAEEREAEERRAAEARAEQERQAAEERAEEQRRAAEERAEEERRAAQERAEREEAERQAAAEREAEERAAAEREAEERRAEERRAAEAREAEERRAMEDALREAQGTAGAEGADTASTGNDTGGNSQMIEGGSGASAAQDPLAAALAGAMSDSAADSTAPPADPGMAQPMQLMPSPIEPRPLPDPAEAAPENDTYGMNGGAPSSEPLSLAEKDKFRVALGDQWNVGALSAEGLQMHISVAFDISRNGRPNTDSIRLVDYRNGSEAAARQAFEVARRGIIMSGRGGFPLPPGKYDRWHSVVAGFSAEGVEIE